MASIRKLTPEKREAMSWGGVGCDSSDRLLGVMEHLSVRGGRSGFVT